MEIVIRDEAKIVHERERTLRLKMWLLVVVTLSVFARMLG